jgi:hypothetical protein
MYEKDNQPLHRNSVRTLSPDHSVWAPKHIGPTAIPAPLAGIPVGAKVSEHLSAGDFLRLYDAVAFANTRGWVMNVELTMTFHVPDNEALATFQDFMKRYRSWCGYKGIPCVAIYVWERPTSAPLHVHMQMFIPNEWHYAAKIWLPKMGQKGIASYKLRVRRTASVTNQWAWFRYLSKGLNPRLVDPASQTTLAAHLRLKIRPQGLIGFRRSGRTKAISSGCQKAAIDRREFHFLGLLNWIAVDANEWWSDCWIRQYNFRHGPKRLF